MAQIPARFTIALSALPTKSVQLGYGGLKLFEPEEIAQGQVGYSTKVDGSSLYGPSARDWSPAWLVIGYESSLGDPLILDTADNALPVMTAMNGAGAWEPTQIANSVECFVQIFEALATLSENREHPVELADHPLTISEREEFLRCVATCNASSSPDFWTALIEE